MTNISKLPASLRNFPHQFLPFVGRETELAEITRRIQDVSCRLITLIGPGGIGKSRLANHVGQTLARQFADGCVWINLQPVASIEGLFPALVEQIGAPPLTAGDPFEQLAAHLHEREQLIILDNFEQIHDGAPLLSQLLIAAPNLKLLITSREALNLHEEWVYRVEGLSYPHGKTDAPQTYSAVQLFGAFASHVNPDFSLEHERDDVIRICQAVEGMPLALELAAAWARTLTCADIAAEIERGLDFLTTNMRNLPERHRRIYAIFEQSCAMLSADENDVFRRLAVFEDGFTREAAEDVAGATLPILARLIDTSLLKRNPDGRYHLHRLIAQFADEKLAQSASEQQETEKCHCAYYLGLLQHWTLDDLMGCSHQMVVDAIKPEMDNIRTAWRWAIDHLWVEVIQGAAILFSEFCQMQSLFKQAIDIFDAAARALHSAVTDEEIERTLVLIQCYQAAFYIRVGRLAEAEQILHNCEARYTRLGIPPVFGFSTDPAFSFGLLELIRGNYEAAMRYGERMRATSEAHPHPYNRILAHQIQCSAALGLGEYESVQRHAQIALTLLNQRGNQWLAGSIYNQLGMAARALLDYETARQYFQASLTIREAFNDLAGVALASSLLGEIALLQERYDDARQYLESSLSIYRTVHDWGGIVKVLNAASVVATATGQYATARNLLQEGLEIAVERQFVSLLLLIVINIAELLVSTGDSEHASELLALVAVHEATDPETLAVVHKVRQRYDLTMMSAENLPDFDATIARMRLAFPAVFASDVPDNPPDSIPKFKQALIEPLSQREQEILHYIAAGLQNREIAEQVFITVGTVKSHVNAIYRKLDVRNRVEAVARAKELNLL